MIAALSAIRSPYLLATLDRLKDECRTHRQIEARGRISVLATKFCDDLLASLAALEFLLTAVPFIGFWMGRGSYDFAGWRGLLGLRHLVREASLTARKAEV